jgi:peptidoglycan/LPS O-acetylase OafA/YrhL
MSDVASLLERIRLRLSRVSSGALVPELEGLRFFAIIAVVIFHTNGYVVARTGAPAPGTFLNAMQIAASSGGIGVSLFFAISGFVLSYPFAQHTLAHGPPIGMRPYFIRRLTRLEPPYVVNLLITSFALVSMRLVDARELLPHLLASMLYSHGVIYGKLSTVNYVTWSLEVEVQFYILAPVLARIFTLRPLIRRSIVLALAVIVPVVNLTLIPWESRYRLALPAHLHLFLLGFLLADLFIVEWQRAPKRSALWDILGLMGFALLVPAKSSNVALQLAAPWLILAGCLGAFKGIFLNKIVTRPWLMTIGGMCYTIYLYHPLIISTFGRLLGSSRFGSSYARALPLGALLIAGVLVVSAVLFVLFEKPFMRKNWHIALFSSNRVPRRDA